MQTPVTPVSLDTTGKKKLIKKYLIKHGYLDNCIDSLSETNTNELFALYIQDVISDKVTRLYGHYATYYANKKNYDKMVEYYVLAIEASYNDSAAIQELYKYINNKTCDLSYINRVCKVFKEKSDTANFDKYSKLLHAPFNNKLYRDIDECTTNNDTNKLYQIYTDCKDDSEKVMYLSKVMVSKNFKPTKKMIEDILDLDFTNASPEIHLIKSVFAGMNRKDIPL